MSDPIDDFIALPKDQQLATLGKLPADKQQKLLDQVRTRRATPSPPAPPGFFEPHPEAGHRTTEALRGGLAGLKGLWDAVRHPIQAVEGMGEQVITGGSTPYGTPLYAPTGNKARDEQNRQVYEGIQSETAQREGQQMREHPAFTAASIIVPALASEGVAKVAPKVVPPMFKRGVEIVSDTGPKVTKNLAKETAAANEASATSANKANAAATEKTIAERGAVDDANAKQAAKDKEARLKVRRENKATAEAHAAGREDTEAANREAIRQQEKIAPTQEKLDSASAEMRAREESAREKALQIGNEKFNTVNEELNPLPADMEKVQNLYGEAHSVLGETQSEPPILKRLGQSIEKGEALSYKDLQAAYSELGKELSKGTLDGRVYHAYDILHDGIGEDMQRMADSKDMGGHLKDARDYWRRMKQTFGKPLSMTDNATAAVRTANPEFLSGDTQANRLRLLGSFDPEIPKVAQHIENLRQGLDALPKPAPVREVTKVPAAAPEPKPLPRPTPPKQYAEPHGSTPRVEKKVGTEEIRGAKKNSLAERAEAIRTRGGSYANTFVALDAIRNAIHGNFGGIATDAAARGAFGVAKHQLANLLEKPAVVDFLTKPTAADIAKIPPELRGDLSGIVAEAQKRGIKVAPALIAALAVSQVKHPTFSQQSPVQ